MPPTNGTVCNRTKPLFVYSRAKHAQSFKNQHPKKLDAIITFTASSAGTRNSFSPLLSLLSFTPPTKPPNSSSEQKDESLFELLVKPSSRLSNLRFSFISFCSFANRRWFKYSTIIDNVFECTFGTRIKLRVSVVGIGKVHINSSQSDGEKRRKLTSPGGNREHYIVRGKKMDDVFIVVRLMSRCHRDIFIV